MESREARKERITRQRQEQILEAARRVFSRLGFDRATVPDVAMEAGIAVGTIYNYYRSKRTLLIAIIARYLIEPFTQIARRTPKGDETSYISALMKDRLDFGLEGVEKLIPLLGEIQREPELREIYVEQVLRPVMGMMEKYVASRVKEGAFRDLDPVVVTRAIGGMVIGFMLLYRIEGEKSPIYSMNRKQLADNLAELALKGLQRQ